MKEKLLSVLCAEYQKMTGLDNVNSESKVIFSHVKSLASRLEKNLNFKILLPKDNQFLQNMTVADFLPCIEEGCRVYDELAAEISEVAIKLGGHKYDQEQILFVDFPREEAGLYLFKLKQILLQRRGKEDLYLDGVKISEIADFLFSLRKEGTI